MAPGENEDEFEDISPHVHLVISKRKKKRWMEYAEENSQGNLSSIIEDAMEFMLSDVWVLKSETEPNNEVNVDFSGIQGDLGEITELLLAIQDQLDTVSGGETTPAARLRGEELMRLASRVHDTLPLVTGTDELVDLKKSGVTLPPDERAKLSGTADDIAAHLEEDPFHILQACLFLEHKEDLNVFSLIDEGERRWYELNPNMVR